MAQTLILDEPTDGLDPNQKHEVRELINRMSEEALKKKEAKLLARDKAEEFSSRHSNWVYEISESDDGNLVKKLSELLEEETEGE